MFPTVSQLLRDAASKHGRRPALHRQTRQGLEIITHEVLDAYSETLARWVVAQGGAVGDRICIIGPNGPDWVMAALGILRAGRVLVPLDMQFTADEITGLVDHSEATALIVSRQYSHLDQIKDHPGLSQWPLEDLIRDMTQMEGDSGPLPECDPEDLAVLLYTSGTSGAPKGVPMSHRNVTSNVLAVGRRLGPKPTDVWLSLLPLSHGLELCMGLLAPLCWGASICYPRSRRPDLILGAMRDAKASVLPCVPAVLEFFARAIRQRAPGGWRGKMVRLALALMPMGMRRWSVTKLSGMPLGSLRAVICGGAFLPLELEDFWRGMGQPIIQGYGMTEAGPVVSVNRLKRPTRQSAGKLVENVEVRIADKNAEGIGEIQVKSPGVMKGYFKNEEATREAFTEDGWLRTGDLGYMDDKDELHVAGRLKDVIITGNGLNVYPEEVEAKLQEHPLVKMACVVQRPIAARGRRAERDGDQVWAAVVLDPEALEREMPQIMNDTKKLQELISQILAETNSRLAPYKRPAGADNWEELPLTRSGKVRRQKVREIYLKGGETEPVTP